MGERETDEGGREGGKLGRWEGKGVLRDIVGERENEGGKERGRTGKMERKTERGKEG